MQLATQTSLIVSAIGVALAVVTILTFKSRKLQYSAFGFPMLLASFPLFYIGFELAAGQFQHALFEISTGVLFVAIAWGCMRMDKTVTLLLLALGYILHALYDVTHDWMLADTAVPHWWPVLCGSFDLCIGAFLLLLASSEQNRDNI